MKCEHKYIASKETPDGSTTLSVLERGVVTFFASEPNGLLRAEHEWRQRAMDRTREHYRVGPEAEVDVQFDIEPNPARPNYLG